MPVMDNHECNCPPDPMGFDCPHEKADGTARCTCGQAIPDPHCETHGRPVETPCICPPDAVHSWCPEHGQPDDGYPGLPDTPGTALARMDAEPTDPSGTPLRLVPTAALTFALGYTATQPVRADRWGGVCALVEELQNRPANPEGLTPEHTAYDDLLVSLPTEVAKQLSMLYAMQRAQRWSQTGRRNG